MMATSVGQLIGEPAGQWSRGEGKRRRGGPNEVSPPVPKKAIALALVPIEGPHQETAFEGHCCDPDSQPSQFGRALHVTL